MYKFRMKLLYNEEKLSYSRTGLLNFKFTLPCAELAIVGSRSVPNDLIFSDNILVTIQLVTFLFLSNIRELIIGTKT